MADCIILQKIECLSAESGGKWIVLTKDSKGIYKCGGIRVEFCEKESGVAVKLRAETGISRISIQYRTNLSSEVKIAGDAWERGYGDLEWRSIVAERIMPWYFNIIRNNFNYGIGVQTGARAMCSWQVTPQKIYLNLDVRNGGQDVELSGRELEVCTIVERVGKEGETAFEAATAFCVCMCKNPRIPQVPVYGSNNWYYAYGESSHEDIIADTDILAELTKGLINRPFMVIDDGWQKSHNRACTGGPWDLGNYKFPNMKKLSQEIKAKDVRPGIWMRPLCTSETFPKECLLDNNRFKEGPDHEYYLDPSHPFVIDKIKKDIGLLRAQGYELIKHDFSTFDLFGRWGFEMDQKMTNENWHFFDRSRTTAEIILGLYEAIREGAGEDVLILGCNTVSHLAAGLVDIQRTGDDTSGLEWERTRKMGINTLAFRMPQHNTFYAVDADCVGITENIDWRKNKQWLELLSGSGTPLFISANPKTTTQEQKEEIRKAFQIAAQGPKIAEPMDWQYNTCPCNWKIGESILIFDWN